MLSFDVYLSLDTFTGDSDVHDQAPSKLRKELAVMEVLLEEPVFEFFVTLTESWFWLDNEYPINRQELLDHDPVGAELIERS